MRALREALADDDVLVSDVGAHKLWIARMYHCTGPNTCVIPNGFASMGIALPGAIGAKLVLGDRPGVGRVFGLRLTGFPAWFAWRVYYLLALPH